MILTVTKRNTYVLFAAIPDDGRLQRHLTAAALHLAVLNSRASNGEVAGVEIAPFARDHGDVADGGIGQSEHEGAAAGGEMGGVEGGALDCEAGVVEALVVEAGGGVGAGEVVVGC